MDLRGEHAVESPLAWGRAMPWLVLICTLALATGLRLLHLAEESPWSDEIVSLQFLGAPDLFAYLGQVRQIDPVMTPLYFTLQYAWAQRFGDTVYALRCLSVLFGVLTVAVVFGIGRRLYGDLAGCVAALCVAINGMHVQYSQEVRMYALCWLLAACSVYTFLRIREGAGRAWWALHFAANAALLATHFFNALLLPVEAALMLWPPMRRRCVATWFAGNAVLAAALAWWITTMDFARMRGASTWLERPSLEGIGQMVGWYSGAGGFQIRAAVPGWLHAMDPGLKAACVLVFLAAGAWTLLGLLRREARRPLLHARSFAAALLLAWVFVPVVLLALESYLYRPAFTGRYTGYVSLALYVMLGGAIASLRQAPARCILTAIVVGLFGIQALVLALSRPIRTDWYGAVALIESQGAGLPVYANSRLAARTLRYYLPEETAVVDFAESADFGFAGETPFWLVYDPMLGSPVAPVLAQLESKGVRCDAMEFAGRYGALSVYSCGTE